MAITPPVYPWLTTNDLVAAVQRKISFPTSQSTFQTSDILAFINEEMMISQVPSVLQYHQEFFVYKAYVPLISFKTRYPIPNRAIGMKLRDVFYVDQNGNYYEMTRVNPEEKAWFQRDFNTGRQPYPYYLEGNDIVFTSTQIPNPTGYLQISFFIRPNQLVTDDNAAIITNFARTITIENSLIQIGDNIQLSNQLPQVAPNFISFWNTPNSQFNAENNPTVAILSVVASSPAVNQFVIGATGTDTATNLVNAINSSIPAVATATSMGNVVTVNFLNGTMSLGTNDSNAFIIPTTSILSFENVPTNLIDGSVIDFLQTEPGHKIENYDVTIPMGGVSGNNITFNTQDVPTSAVLGDYVCLANSAIIPYLPPDMHTLLAERASARILSAIGDLENLQAVNARINEMEKGQGTLILNRIEGRPQKVGNKHSLLRYGKRMIIRRF